MILATALLCLAANVYHEGRGERVDGQHAIAQVTMNRAHGDEAKVCKVVAKPNQFSWTSNLAVKGGRHLTLNSKGLPHDKKAWATAMYVAKFTLDGVVPDIVKGAKFYHTKAVRPGWDKKMKVVATYGNHRFYRSV